MRFRIAVHFFLFFMLFNLSIVSMNPGWTDCRSEGQQAVSMLMSFKQSALNNQSVDQVQFKSQFEPLVYRMKQDGCMSELMGLMNVIQNEQQQYPNPATARK